MPSGARGRGCRGSISSSPRMRWPRSSTRPLRRPASAGAALVVAQRSWPVSLVGGISPTVLSESQIGGKDYGMPFQFTSYAGLSLQLGSHVEVGYRFQHMSNASLAD
ncbi:MAG: acyloxyacyl hydrolase, partial [Verrucomicrobiota bacterium]